MKFLPNKSENVCSFIFIFTYLKYFLKHKF